jgi:tetratricopeptide (TPR) repeat protein/serine/threonine protein kinase
MTPKSIDLIFWEAVQLPDERARREYLDRACGGSAELRGRVEQLLAVHVQASDFLETPALGLPGLVATLDEERAERPGTVIGPYKLLEQIGEGGFGVVFMAEQQHPVRRKVALKVIKPGMDTRQVIARFEAERQALALMEHPNIARVLDAGTTGAGAPASAGSSDSDSEDRLTPRLQPGGRPYFVMELVRGLSMTDYCDQNNLPIRERLELFVDVCQAVQHAHQKGIIHRDIKPSNVLVTLHDGKPVVKVIDFGVAKALGQQLTDKTLFTNFAQMIGTPLYMSPEQAEWSGLDVDTRSDIYSLGVLLYELLTGTTPFDKERLKQASFDEIRRIIREEEPPKPSTRMSQVEHSLRESGRTRSATALHDTAAQATTTASEKRRTDPGKLSRLFRGELDWIVMKALEKDRNRRYETANGLAMDVQRYLRDEPVSACSPSAWYRWRKFVHRHRALLAMAAVVSIAVVLAVATVAGSIGWAARDHAARDAALDATVQRDLDEAEGLLVDGKWPEASAAVERASKFLDAAGRTESHPRLQKLHGDVAMARRLEDIYSQPNMHEFYSGKDQDAAYDQAFRDYGIDLAALPVAEAAERIRGRNIRADLARALDFWSFIRRRAGAASAPDWQQLLEVAKAADRDDWRNQLREAMQRDDLPALKALAATVDIRRLPPETLTLLGRSLAENLKAPEQAVALLRQAQRQYPSDLWINDALAWYCYNLGQFDDSARFYSAARAVRPGSPYLTYSIGCAVLRKDRLPEAAAEFSKAIELKPQYPQAHCSLGWVLRHQGKLPEAEAALREAIRLKPEYVDAYHELGVVLKYQGKPAESEAALREAIRLQPDNTGAYKDLGWFLFSEGKLAEAEAALREAVRLKPHFAEAHSKLGWVLLSQGKLAEAEVPLREAIRVKPDYAEAHGELGWVLKCQGKLPEAESALREAIRLQPDNTGAYKDLGVVLWHQGMLSEAEAALREAIRLKTDYAEAHSKLGWLLLSQGKLAEAETAYREAVRLQPSDDLAHDGLAWLLATCADPKRRNPQEAVALAERAVQLAPKNGNYWNTLGVARYRTGHYQAAITALEESLGLQGGNSLDWFFLAMAHWQLGDADKARQCYDNAVCWMEEHQPKDEELVRFRAEAEELLAINKK